MNPGHLKIEVLHPEPRGGQHVGRSHQTVKVTHLPTGISATCDYERSQMRNKRVCLAMIEYGLAEIGWKDPE